MISTIELDNKVMRRGLCTNCGACQGLCPYWTSFEGRAYHVFECDKSDGRCLHFCPRMPLDWEALRRRFFPEETVTPELGPFRELYLTRAADAGIRAASQHGGTTTALVELALKEGFIDAAVMTKADGGLNAEGVLASTPEEIRACSGSSFQIPPTLAVLNRALAANEYKRIGVVGTPCKTLAVYKMLDKPYAGNDNHAENIGMVFGLFCGWGLDWTGLDALAASRSQGEKLRHMDILPSKYHCMELRGEDKTEKVNLDQVLELVRENCRYCADMTAEFADLSIGGARSEDGWEVDKGWNQLIVRSEKGQALLELARKQGVLEFKEVPEENLDKLRKASLNKKRTALAALKEQAGAAGGLGYLEPSVQGKLFLGIEIV